jgi:hypothetical protein
VSSRGAEGGFFGVHRPGGCYQHPSGHSIFMAGARAEQNSRRIARPSCTPASRRVPVGLVAAYISVGSGPGCAAAWLPARGATIAAEFAGTVLACSVVRRE